MEHGLLKARFDREHALVPAEPFVTTAMRRIRAGKRQMAMRWVGWPSPR